MLIKYRIRSFYLSLKMWIWKKIIFIILYGWEVGRVGMFFFVVFEVGNGLDVDNKYFWVSKWYKKCYL